MLDGYVTRIRQFAVLLGYGDPQILEVFKNTVPNRLYWVVFSIEDLRQEVETAKRFLTKDKIDRQLLGQSTETAPFKKVSNGYKSSNKRQYHLTLSKQMTKLIILLL